MAQLRAACVLVLCEGKVLAVETAHRPGELSLPGGKIDPGESAAEAAAREALEETTLLVELESEPLYVGAPGSEDMLAATFRATRFAGVPSPASDAVAVRWVEASELLAPRNRYAEYNRRVLEAAGVLGARG